MFFNLLNSTERSIRFTMEEESDNRLPFLDVLIERTENGPLQTSVYRKATNTARVIQYESNHPAGHKRSIVRMLFSRIETHCSTDGAKTAERAYLKRLFRQNGYPNKFIRSSIQKQAVVPREDQKVWASLPYVSGISEATARRLKPLNIRVAHKPNNTIRHILMRPKDSVDQTEMTNIIYEIPCRSCDWKYVGQSSRQMRTRLKEHIADVRRDSQLSQVAEHTRSTGHQFAFDQTRVIDRGKLDHERLFKEAWYSDERCLNRHIELYSGYKVIRTRVRTQQQRLALKKPLVPPQAMPDDQ